ncbi:hypothetical protein ABZW11_08415, partial [Nonomuraea sp. NPDC004580]|uniref:hypothetical protein n=1 Tax=Nonomuraea sp. NPDC004580 TaxID=3154552 RepID=UPI0033AE52F0
QVQQGVKRPASEAAAAVVAAATADLPTGTLIGPAGVPDDTLRQYLTEEVTAAVRRWTPRLLGA